MLKNRSTLIAYNCELVEVDPLLELAVRGFIPASSGKNITERKIQLRDIIRVQNPGIDKMTEKCRDRLLSIDVCFYLYNGSTEAGRVKKDLDNMMKIICDVLPEYMVGDGTEKIGHAGLGLISNNSDDSIYEIHCFKKLVNDIKDEGIDLKIYEWKVGNFA